MNFIVAVSNDYAIGKDNDLLFHLPTDLKYFKEKTMGKVVIMGERTYHSLPKRPLPNRVNIVLSNDPNFYDDNIVIVRNVEELFNSIKDYDSDNVFVCGGASVYNLLMDYCEKAYITKIDKTVPADTFINNIEKMDNWVEIESSEIISENDLNFTFKIFKNTDVKVFNKK